MEVVKTTHAGHAKSLVSTFDFSTCPNGIVCVGGDGIVNEVLNGLLIRDDRTEAVSIPVGIIPAGSDNSLVWTVLGVRDPISASLLIVKLEYLPSSKEMAMNGKGTDQDKNNLSSVYTDVMHGRSKRDGIPRASSLSSIDSIMTPSRMSLGDGDTSEVTLFQNLKKCCARNHIMDHSGQEPAPSNHDKEDNSSTISDPGPIWDSEPKWDTGPKWDNELTWEPDAPIELPGPPEDRELGAPMELVPNLDEKWVVRKGHFLGVLVKSVKLKPGANTHNGCGIDGELCRVKGQLGDVMVIRDCMVGFLALLLW
nr:unnamed protein product [Digitaria exilis]